MKHLLIVLCLGLALAVHASARLVVPSLSEAVTPDAAINRGMNNCVLCAACRSKRGFAEVNVGLRP